MRELLRNISVFILFFLSTSMVFADDFHTLIKDGGVTSVVKELQRDPRLASMKDELGRTPLHLAVDRGDFQLTNIFINAGCHVNEIDDLKGYTALHYAALRNHSRILKFLLSRRADMTIQDNDGNFPLHIAAANGCVDAVETMLEQEADPNCMNRAWKNPLHLVALGTLNEKEFPFSSRNYTSYLKVAKLLLEKGAFPTLRDIFHDTPESIVVRNWKESPFSRELIKLIFAYKGR